MPIPRGTRASSAAHSRHRTHGHSSPRPTGGVPGLCRVTAGPRGLTVPPAGRDVALAARVLRGAEHKPFTPSCSMPRCVIDINKHSPTLQLI